MRWWAPAILASLAPDFYAAAATGQSPVVKDGSVACKIPWSIQMADSIMARKQGIMTGAGGSSELLQAGFTQRALTSLIEVYHGTRAAARAQEYIRDSAVSTAPFLSNASYQALSYPLDRLSNGIAMLTTPSANATEAAELKAAALALRQSINVNRRNQFGGLWYYVYPEWSYLDGMYSLAPFYTFYSLTQESTVNTTALSDMQKQMDLLWQHNRNQTSGLLVHGYDASRTAVWANPVTGASPIVWGRSLGWFAMSLVDTLDVIKSNKAKSDAAEKQAADLLAMFRDLAPAIMAAADPKTGAWWQVVDQPNREKNYIESSGSAMFAYSLMKGARMGLLDSGASKARTIGLKAQKYLTDTFVVKNGDGTLSWNGTVAVCSLNSTAAYEVSSLPEISGSQTQVLTRKCSTTPRSQFSLIASLGQLRTCLRL